MEADGQGTLNRLRWHRIPCQTTVTLPLPGDGALSTHSAPGAPGIELAVLCRPTRILIDDVERDVLAVTTTCIMQMSVSSPLDTMLLRNGMRMA